MEGVCHRWADPGFGRPPPSGCPRAVALLRTLHGPREDPEFAAPQPTPLCGATPTRTTNESAAEAPHRHNTYFLKRLARAKPNEASGRDHAHGHTRRISAPNRHRDGFSNSAATDCPGAH